MLATMLAALRWTIGLAWLLFVGLVFVLPAVGFTLGTQVPPRLPPDWRVPVRHADGDSVVAGFGRRDPRAGWLGVGTGGLSRPTTRACRRGQPALGEPVLHRLGQRC